MSSQGLLLRVQTSFLVTLLRWSHFAAGPLSAGPSWLFWFKLSVASCLSASPSVFSYQHNIQYWLPQWAMSASMSRLLLRHRYHCLSRLALRHPACCSGCRPGCFTIPLVRLGTTWSRPLILWLDCTLNTSLVFCELVITFRPLICLRTWYFGPHFD